MSDDELWFAEEDEVALPPGPGWRVLVVDDDPQVHRATTIALQGEVVLHRPLELLHASSSDEACALLAQHDDVAVILLDVVMESDDAGLQLVRIIRGELGRHDVRIILRTGQPGYAPELTVIRDYDINDYKTKDELTRTRLLTSVTTAVRSFDQLRRLNAGRRGLDLIVRSAADLFACRALGHFAEGVLTQVAALLAVQPEGVVCARVSPVSGQAAARGAPGELYVVGAAGRYGDRIGRPLAELGDARIIDKISRAHDAATHLYDEDGTVLHVSPRALGDAFVFVDGSGELDEVNRQLLEVFCTNISVAYENVELVQQLSRQAYQDALCRIPNRSGFFLECDKVCTPSDSEWMVFGVTLIDVSSFAEINNALGYAMGDRLLVEIARRLTQEAGHSVVVGRVSGDGFALFGEIHAIHPDVVASMLGESVEVGGISLPIRLKMGFACANDVDGGVRDVLKSASIALTQAKRDPGCRFHTYARWMAAAARQRLDMLTQLRQALADNQLQLFYQPKVDLRDGHVTGVEALLRWQLADGSWVPPDQLVALAESAGLIEPLGLWVLNEAVRQRACWRDSPSFAHLSVAVNVSVGQLRSLRFVDQVRDVLSTHGVSPHCLELEITESVAMLDPQGVIDILTRLKSLGLQLSIDDFGTGYSSLSYLQRLPLDVLKIDRSFVSALTTTQVEVSHGVSIARMLADLGASLQLQVVAEGIETAEQLAALKAMGCTLGQGYYYSRPLPAPAFERWLSERGR